MSKLFSELALGPLTLDNRIVIAPMCQYSAQDGIVQPWHHQHLGNLAQSGAGLLIVEASAVNPEGRITYADAGIWNDATREAWSEVLQSIRRYSPMPIAIQLAHAGRKASTEKPWLGGQVIAADQPNGWQALAPSAMPYAEDNPVPEAMTSAQIDQVVDDFVAAAQRAVEAGFDAIELHAAHGYLMHQFLSPLSNHRDDQYGGSAEHRMRLPLRVFDAVKAVLPKQVALGVRISAVDWAEQGLALEQSVAFARALDERGCHFIHVSSGGLTEHQQIKAEPNYQVPFAEAIKAAVDMPVIAVGLITEPEQAESILTASQADGIAIARGILYDPRWPWHAAAALGDTVAAAPQYLRCQPRGLSTLLVRHDDA